MRPAPPRFRCRARGAAHHGLRAAPKTLRIAMTASDVPTTAGMPNNGFEGMRFLGFPVFEPLVDWDLTRADQAGRYPPGPGGELGQDAADPARWRFTLRQGVSFHDGTAFSADSVIWNLDRFYKNDSPQFEPGRRRLCARPRLHHVGLPQDRRPHGRDRDLRPVSYLPYLLTWILFTSPADLCQPPATTGARWPRCRRRRDRAVQDHPLRAARSRPSCRATTATGTPTGSPSSTASCCCRCRRRIPAWPRCAAARSTGSRCRRRTPSPASKQAGFQVVTNSYPHVWPWVFAAGKPGSPVADVRVRQALNYCIDRDGMLALLNGTAEPSVGFYKANDRCSASRRTATSSIRPRARR